MKASSKSLRYHSIILAKGQSKWLRIQARPTVMYLGRLQLSNRKESITKGFDSSFHPSTS